MAVKVLRAGNGGAASGSLQAELAVLGGLRHPRIVTMLCACSELTSSEGCAALSDEAYSTPAQHA